MKIAIMMRAMEQDNSFRAIIEGLVETMLKLNKDHTYLLFYRTDKWLGRFSAFSNAKEIVLRAPHKLLWDQIAVPYRAWTEKADVIYNPKFSVPLISSCSVTMGLHEPAWWVWPKHYEWLDRNYIKLMLPLYIRKSAHLFAISHFVIDENRKFVDFPVSKATVAYPAPKAYFKPMNGDPALDEFRNRYRLPEQFMLSVTRADHPGLDNSTSFFPGKNVDATVRAFMLCREKVPHKLVIAGRNIKEYLLHAGFTERDLEGIVFMGFVKHEELPKLLNLAEVFILPSFYESYAMALVEAMACGCPIVAAETGACPEITAGAGLLANPHDPKDFAEKILSILQDNELGRSLKAKSVERAKFFNWDRTASLILKTMQAVVNNVKP